MPMGMISKLSEILNPRGERPLVADSLSLGNSIYSPYSGMARGGPHNGIWLSSDTLTVFIKKPKLFMDKNDYKTVEEYKEQLEQLRIDSMTPYRYDYDMETKEWVYVEYAPAKLEHSKAWDGYQNE